MTDASIPCNIWDAVFTCWMPSDSHLMCAAYITYMPNIQLHLSFLEWHSSPHAILSSHAPSSTLSLPAPAPQGVTLMFFNKVKGTAAWLLCHGLGAAYPSANIVRFVCLQCHIWRALSVPLHQWSLNRSGLVCYCWPWFSLPTLSVCLIPPPHTPRGLSLSAMVFTIG